MADDDIDLGTCCLCGGTENVRNVLMLDFKAPQPGSGCWGCLQCGLPMEGAVAVLCDDCLEKHWTGEPLRFAVKGEPANGERVPIETLTEKFEHDMSKHPEVALYEKWDQRNPFRAFDNLADWEAEYDELDADQDDEEEWE